MRVVKLIGALAVALLLHPGCEANKGNVDAAGAPEEDTSTDDPDAEVEGCDWAAGDWTFEYCNDDDTFVHFELDNCSVELESTSDDWNKATGQIVDAGLVLDLPTGEQCHGHWDGEKLQGACGSLTLCVFEAARR